MAAWSMWIKQQVIFCCSILEFLYVSKHFLLKLLFEGDLKTSHACHTCIWQNIMDKKGNTQGLILWLENEFFSFVSFISVNKWKSNSYTSNTNQSPFSDCHFADGSPNPVYVFKRLIFVNYLCFSMRMYISHLLRDGMECSRLNM